MWLAPAATAGEGAAPQTSAADQEAGARTYNVRSFGAKGDGKELDTAAFQAAIDACTNERGGTVLVPAGHFVVGTIELKSNVTLRLATGARILGSTDIDDYRSRGATPGSSFGRALLYAADAENIVIEGNGTIEGRGKEYLDGARDDGETNPGRPRPHLAEFVRCKGLVLRDFSLLDSAYWCTRITQCSFVRVDGVRIHSRVNFNNDGLHFTSCEHVKVLNCDIACEDDACALFGSNRDVTITNCTFSTRWSVFRFGGGNPGDIAISNCVINDTFGCPIKMQIGAGSRIENVLFSNLVMNNVTGPIYIGLGSSPRNSLKPGETRPGGVVRNLMFRGILATVSAAPDLSGYPYLPNTPISDIYPGEHRTCINLTAAQGQFIENVVFSDVHVTFAGGGTAEEGALRDVPQMSGAEYFAGGVLPAYGLYARNVRGLTLNNVRFEVASPDLRPALVFDGVEDAAVTGFSAQANVDAESMLRFRNTRDVLLSGVRVLGRGGVLLEVEGDRSGDITVAGGDLRKATKPIAFSGGAGSTAVKVRR